MGREAFLAEVRRTLPGTLVEEGGRALLLPRSAHEVAVTMRLAHQLGGTVAVPGADGSPDERVPMDLRRLQEVVAFDEASLLVHVQAGMTLAALEAQLEPRGLTLGLAGAVAETAIGEWLALGAPGAADHGDDPVEQVIAGLESVLPDGRELTIRPAPRRAVGPDLIAAHVGTRGRIGVIVAAHLSVQRIVAVHERAFVFPDGERAEAAQAWMRGRGVRPLRSRLVPIAEGVALIVRVLGEGPRLEAALAVAERTARERGGVPFPTADLPPVAPPARSEPGPLVDQLHDAIGGRA